jgi:benzaldehyde dehydrogenase (NAD)
VCGGVTLARVFEEAGLPEGVLSVLPGDADADADADADEATLRSSSPSMSTWARPSPPGAFRSFLCRGPDLHDHRPAHRGRVRRGHGHRGRLQRGPRRACRRLPVGDPSGAEVALGPVIDIRQRDGIRRRMVTESVDAGAGWR